MRENQYTASISEWYDRIMEAGYYDHKRVADATACILGTRKKVLELGIGTGLFAEQLVKKGYVVSGVDFSLAMLRIAEKRLGKKVKLYEQDVLQLSLPGTYEAAISEGGVWAVVREEDGSFSFLSHITSAQQNLSALKKVADHLQEGGLLLFVIQSAHKNIEMPLKEGAYSQTVHVSSSFMHKEYFVKVNDTVVAHQKCNYLIFSKEQGIALLKKAGFILKEIDALGQCTVFLKRSK